MELQPSQVDIKLAAFHKSWNLERIQNMTLEEYADLNNHDSLCYWLEYETKELGAIGNFPLTKFGVWKPKEEKELKKPFIFENGYFYNSKKGNNLDDAFEKVKQKITQNDIHSQNLNWEEIDQINYNIIPKWKLVFLFSNKATLPIYSRRALSDIVTGLGNNVFNDKTPISILQRHILNYKLESESMEEFGDRMYVEFALKTKPNFYIIGSKYGDDSRPQINEFIKNKCVAVGFYDWLDFSSFIGKNDKEVNDFVIEHWTQDQPAVHKLQSIFTKIANIKEGDIIAVKSHGAFNRLTIIAYAQVVKRNGAVYEHHEDKLGHHINVEFLDAGFSKFVGETYAETIHELTKKKDGRRFDKVFGWYSGIQEEYVKLDEFEDDEEFNEEYLEDTGFAYNEKSEESFNRNAIASVKVNQIHNIIQNRFIRYLTEQYPHDSVKGEKNRIDAKRESSNEVHIYEIKPYENVFSCIRDGIGQLLDYSHQYNTKKDIKIYIVGPNEPNKKDLDFIEAIKNNLKISFNYISFDYSSLISKEF